jgi:hypothetical protein
VCVPECHVVLAGASVHGGIRSQCVGGWLELRGQRLERGLDTDAKLARTSSIAAGDELRGNVGAIRARRCATCGDVGERLCGDLVRANG